MKNSKSKWHIASVCSTLLVLVVLSGCSRNIPTSEMQAIKVLQKTDSISRQSWTENASVVFFKKRPYLAFDAKLIGDMRYWMDKKPEVLSVDLLQGFVLRATELASVTRLKRLAGIPIGNWKGSDFFSDSSMSEWKSSIIDAEQIHAINEMSEISQLENQEQYRSYLESLLKDAEPSIKTRGRTLRRILGAPFAPFIYGWMSYHIMTDDRGPMDVSFKKYQVYEPNSSQDFLTLQNLEQAQTEQLLALYTPRIIQQTLGEKSARKKYNQTVSLTRIECCQSMDTILWASFTLQSFTIESNIPIGKLFNKFQ